MLLAAAILLARAVAEAIATATAEAFAAASSNCAEAVAAAKAVNTKTAIATAIAEISASACSTGGTATATAEAVSKAVATATATAYVDVLAAVSGPCAACGSERPAAGSNKGAQPGPTPSPDNRKPPADDTRKGHKDAGGDQAREQHDKYSPCRPWLKDDCCAGWKGAGQCQCLGFGLRCVLWVFAGTSGTWWTWCIPKLASRGSANGRSSTEELCLRPSAAAAAGALAVTMCASTSWWTAPPKAAGCGRTAGARSAASVTHELYLDWAIHACNAAVSLTF